MQGLAKEKENKRKSKLFLILVQHRFASSTSTVCRDLALKFGTLSLFFKHSHTGRLSLIQFVFLFEFNIRPFKSCSNMRRPI